MSQQTVKQFVAAINRQDVEGIYALMSDDHVFVDAHGNKIQGKDTMKESWAAYFGWFPDYNVMLTEIFEKDGVIAVFGFAGGSYQGNAEAAWKIPAAWKVLVKNNRISHWQVFADTSIPFDVVQKFTGEGEEEQEEN